jgi:predicted dehydrogenase
MIDSGVRCLLVGLGNHAVQDHLPALSLPSAGISLVGVCDTDPGKEYLLNTCVAAGEGGQPVRFYTSLDVALDELRPTLAIVTTPHNTHLPIAYSLASRGIPFLKEKPFAIDLFQAYELMALVERFSANMRLCVQRRFHPLYMHGKRALTHIGQPRHFSTVYQLNASGYRSGWRSRVETAGGGAVVDMGYHIIDLLVWYFGLPTEIYASAAPKRYPENDYTIEETVLATLRYHNGCVGHMTFSLCESRKSEEIQVYGTRGYYILRREQFRRFDETGRTVEILVRKPAWASAYNGILADMIKNLHDRAVIVREITQGLKVMTVIDAIYRSIITHHPITISA